MFMPKKRGTAPHMAFSTPFRAAFFCELSLSAPVSYSLVEVGPSQSFGIDNTFHRTDVLNDRFGDGRQVCSFKLDDEVMVSKQHRCVGNMRQRLHIVVDLLFGTWLDIDEDVSDGHAAQLDTRIASTSPFRFVVVAVENGG